MDFITVLISQQLIADCWNCSQPLGYIFKLSVVHLSTNSTPVAHCWHCLQPQEADIVNDIVAIMKFCVVIIFSALFTQLHIAGCWKCAQIREAVTTNSVSDCHPGKLQPCNLYRRLSSPTRHTVWIQEWNRRRHKTFLYLQFYAFLTFLIRVNGSTHFSALLISFKCKLCIIHVLNVLFLTKY